MIFLLIIGTAMCVFFLIRLVGEYIILASSEHAKSIAKKGHENEAWLYEVGVAYLLWAGLALTVEHMIKKFNLILTVEVFWIYMGFLFLFCCLLVHILCTKIGERYPQLSKCECLQ